MSDLPKREEEILEFWNKEKIFEKSLDKKSPRGEYVFYDGPHFASGSPHYGHILASTIKDAIPRYRTMRGWRVQRRWGWDCHGLPVENLVEKELGFRQKRDIEEYGLASFNEAARAHIMKDEMEWRGAIPRVGRFADMENSYKTMDTSYTESVWWAFKYLHGRGLIYEGFKAMHYCPRCGTTLSNFEVAQGYKDIEDLAVTVKFQLADDPSTSLLIWTTTAWTLPGNAAVAVNPSAIYVKVKTGNEFIIVARELAPEKSVVAEYKGKELIGKKYLPPFDYFAGEFSKNNKIWRVYGADFVSLGEGTGIVHIAPAFGADDLALGQREKVPLIRHITEEGKFVLAVKDLAGLPVKPKGSPRETDEKVAALLEQKGLLFKKEKTTHSYPHCWRCDTPLLNSAASSWFVKVSALKNKLLKENAKIAWVPENVGKGRFHKGIESAPDWAISRSRYWGAPLPVWRHSKTKEIKIIGSIEELLSMVRRSGNRYFVMRHGEAVNNANNVPDPRGDPENHLTETGKAESVRAASELKHENVDLIIVSPFLRTRETAAVVQKELGLPDSAVMIDKRLHELNESDILAVRRRMGEFLFEAERRYTNKNILIISHGLPIWILQKVAARKLSGSFDFDEEVMLKTAELQEIPFVPFPHNQNYELDLHRPYIDEVPMGNGIHGQWQRVPEVFDCWFESGSMPFASNHYPFEKKNFDPERFLRFGAKGYPADFIAEGLDQTRGWFYSLIVLGVALFGRSPYKKVIVNGLVLASDGQKMSKRLKNYPDPMEVVAKYGADALRYYLLSSGVVRAEDLRFNERGVDEVSKKLLMRIDNVRSFYKLYASEKLPSENVLGSASPQPEHFLQEVSPLHILDKWILSRLGELVRDATEGFEKYELDAAVRPLGKFIDDLSAWYVRRSRERFKNGDARAVSTLRFVLYTAAHVMAPVMPFFAEDLYRSVKSKNDPESVHLSDWPEPLQIDENILREMEQIHKAASEGLQLRERAGIKVRQPLAKFTAPVLPENPQLRAILADELNVKEVARVDGEAVLDTFITPQLREEGVVRELVRRVQEWRKEKGYKIADKPECTLAVTEEEMVVANKYRDKIMLLTGLKDLKYVRKNGN